MAEETWNRTAGGVTLIETLERYWWLFVLRGIAAIVFGVLSFYWPGITLLTLVLFYGAYALVDGIFALIAGIMGRTGMETRWWLILHGVLLVGFGFNVWKYRGQIQLQPTTQGT